MSAHNLTAYWSGLKRATIHPDDHCLITGRGFETRLKPVPWIGNLKSAKIYFLFLNPGLSSDDEPGELKAEKKVGFQQALQRNLNGNEPYLYFQDRFEGHPGCAWARKIFGCDITMAQAKQFCQIQLVPYHSRKGDIARKIAHRLPSSEVVRRFARDVLVPRAAKGEIGLVVARSSRLWGICPDLEGENLVVYQRGEYRSALQTENTRGGKLLRRRLCLMSP